MLPLGEETLNPNINFVSLFLNNTSSPIWKAFEVVSVDAWAFELVEIVLVDLEVENSKNIGV